MTGLRALKKQNSTTTSLGGISKSNLFGLRTFRSHQTTTEGQGCNFKPSSFLELKPEYNETEFATATNLSH
jgi:hypothetical protein